MHHKLSQFLFLRNKYQNLFRLTFKKWLNIQEKLSSGKLLTVITYLFSRLLELLIESKIKMEEICE
jgi:hypothetical protein